MAHPLSNEPLSTVHVKDGDILTLGRWQQLSLNPSAEPRWDFQQFDVVFTSDDVTPDTIDRYGLNTISEKGDWGVFAIKRPQVNPPVLEAPEVDETPTDS